MVVSQMYLSLLCIFLTEDDTAVILRDKPKLRSLYAMEEGEESGASSCCLCCRHPDRSRQSYALVKKERSCCRKLHCCVYFCPVSVYLSIWVKGLSVWVKDLSVWVKGLSVWVKGLSVWVKGLSSG